MKVLLSPQRRDDNLVVSRAGDALTVNGLVFDFSQMGEGDILPAEAIDSTWFAGPVTRTSGELVLTLFLPLPTNYSPAQAFPEPLTLTADGPVSLPQPLPTPEAAEEPNA